jgi:8-oxo-dGTP diphosphatase
VRSGQRLAAYALIADGSGRVLLARHPDERRRTGRWLLPGGGVEYGEHPEQAVVREVREETGLDVRVGGLLTVVSDVGAVGRRHRMLHTVRLIYRASLAPDETGSAADRVPDDVRWCTPQQWRALPLVPFAARVLSESAPDPV